ncbi:MAG: ATP-binding cassette domain-containing protein [Clostridiales Family XIII bacterium]|nr:ATP-binding cassette domain-containing protein [Clostridiales Family XIII bacterium]
MSISARIVKRFRGFALDVDFESESKALGILGASGSGKTLILKSIAGLVTPDEGRIAIGERVIYDSAAHVDVKPQRRGVGYFFQSYALFPHMTVQENIGIAVNPADDDDRSQSEIVSCLTERYQLAGLEHRYPANLSGGQQQRVALARIFASRPEAVLLDEPFSALDSYLRGNMQDELLRAMEDYQGQFILVTHSCDEAALICDTIITISGGKITSRGGVDKAFDVCGGCRALGKGSTRPSSEANDCFMRP